MRYAFLLLICAVGLFTNVYAITQEDRYTGPVLIDASIQQQELIQYAREISQDFDFILTVFAESGFRPHAIGDQGKAYGVCQRRPDLGRKRLTDDPRFQDPKFQIDSCWNSYTIWRANGKLKNRLYGYNVRLKHKDRFKMGL